VPKLSPKLALVFCFPSLLFRLSEGAACVTELAEAEGETLSTISQRLIVLRSEDLVMRCREGKHIRYALTDDHVRALIAAVFAHAQDQDIIEH
jgi:ArsR family transcriptional regulator, lead/cadmium/zinc/bismuth-responsive transcriptional repressor